MPANLPPQYFAAEKTFHQAKTAPEKIAALEEMLVIMPKHKGTDHLRAELRTRIAKLTQTLDKKTAVHRASMIMEKEGAGQVAVPWSDDCIPAQPRYKRHRFPVTAGGLAETASAALGPAIFADHVRSGAGFIEKNQS